MSLEDPSVSVVDQRASLATGAVRRLLLRAVLVLGGVFAVTVIGWLCCASSANADVLPSAPAVPSVLSSVAADPTAASVTSDVAAVTPKQVEQLAVSSLSAVGKQAHGTVTEVSQRVAPSVIPAADLVKHTDLVPLATRVVPTGTRPATKDAAATQAGPRPSAHPVRRVSPALSQPWRPFFVVVQHHRHVSQSATPRPRSAGATPSPVGVDHHSPAMPPLQPAGSSDSSAHSGGGVAGGPGGAQVRCTHFLGDGLTMADTSSTPRIAAGPGRQPGTSPD